MVLFKDQKLAHTDPPAVAVMGNRVFLFVSCTESSVCELMPSKRSPPIFPIELSVSCSTQDLKHIRDIHRTYRNNTMFLFMIDTVKMANLKIN